MNVIVHCVSSGAEAMSYLENNTVDLVLADVKMGPSAMSGVELLQTIRGHPRLFSLTVALISCKST